MRRQEWQRFILTGLLIACLAEVVLAAGPRSTDPWVSLSGFLELLIIVYIMQMIILFAVREGQRRIDIRSRQDGEAFREELKTLIERVPH